MQQTHNPATEEITLAGPPLASVERRLAAPSATVEREVALAPRPYSLLLLLTPLKIALLLQGMRSARRRANQDYAVFQALRLKFQVSSSRSQVPGSRFQVSGFRFQVSSSRLPVAGFRFRARRWLRPAVGGDQGVRPYRAEKSFFARAALHPGKPGRPVAAEFARSLQLVHSFVPGRRESA